MNPTAELRRQYRAARHLSRADELRRRLDDRTARAAGCLNAALGSAERTTVPGYAVTRCPEGIRVEAIEPINADQLALWTQLREERQA
jgi:hypothetical protein